MLVAYLIAAPLVWPSHNHARDALLVGLYVSDYSYTFWHLPYFLRHSWSLAVEEHFYLIWPLLLPLAMRLREPLGALGGLYLLSLLWREWFVADWVDYYYRFDTRLSGLIAGILLFLTLPRLRLCPRHGYAAAALLALLFASASINGAAWFIPLAEVAAAVLIGCAATGQLGHLAPPLRSGAAVRLGQLSYGVYLWHFPIAFWARQHWGFAESAAATLFISVPAAWFSHVTVEAWARRMRRHLSKPSRPGAAKAARSGEAARVGGP